MPRTIKPPYQLIEFSGGGLKLGGYAQPKGFLPPIATLRSRGGLRLGGRASTLSPVSAIGGIRMGGRARVLSRIGEYSPALGRLGSTSGMTEVVNSPNSGGTQYLPDIGFPFPIYGSTYQSSIAISSEWALLFGFSSLSSSDISRTVPGRAFLMAASRARSWDRVLVQADNSYSYRIRFEARISFGLSPTYNTFEVTLYSDGSIQLVCGTDFDLYGFFGQPRVRSLTKGDNVSYTDFDQPSDYYDNYPDTDSVNAGIKISFVFTPNDNAGSSHTVRVGSYPETAPKIIKGGLRLGGQARVAPPASSGYAIESSAGMTQIVSSYGDDGSVYLPDIGFDFPIYGSTYRSNISIGSNWYLLFGTDSTNFSGLTRTNPGRGLLFGAADRSWEKVYFKAESGYCRIRFEGHIDSSSSSGTAIFQIKLFDDGAIELTIGIGCFYDSNSDIKTLTKDDDITYTDFTVPSGSALQSDFLSSDVLTSLIFRPVDAAGNSHTVATGSYS